MMIFFFKFGEHFGKAWWQQPKEWLHQTTWAANVFVLYFVLTQVWNIFLLFEISVTVYCLQPDHPYNGGEWYRCIGTSCSCETQFHALELNRFIFHVNSCLSLTNILTPIFLYVMKFWVKLQNFDLWDVIFNAYFFVSASSVRMLLSESNQSLKMQNWWR